jgi:hypothetical protein
LKRKTAGHGDITIQLSWYQKIVSAGGKPGHQAIAESDLAIPDALVREYIHWPCRWGRTIRTQEFGHVRQKIGFPGFQHPAAPVDSPADFSVFTCTITLLHFENESTPFIKQVMNMDEEEAIAARRDFLRLAAVGAIASLALPGCSDSSAEDSSPRIITIFGIIDIAQALADNSLNNNIYWLDNNKAAGSQFHGTDHLRTAINKGNLVQWFVYGLQVETSADIASISGPAVAIANPALTPIAPGFTFWRGQIAPSANGDYQYAISLNVEGRLMTATSPLTLDVL